MIETLYPGVFVTEIAFRAHPIEGVSTSQPGWTAADTHDPGITLLELLAWTAEPLPFRVEPCTTHVPLHAAVVRHDGRSGDD